MTGVSCSVGGLPKPRPAARSHSHLAATATAVPPSLQGIASELDTQGCHPTDPGLLPPSPVLCPAPTLARRHQLCLVHRVDLGLHSRTSKALRADPRAEAGKGCWGRRFTESLPTLLGTLESQIWGQESSQSLVTLPNPGLRHSLQCGVTGGALGGASPRPVGFARTHARAGALLGDLSARPPLRLREQATGATQEDTSLLVP